MSSNTLDFSDLFSWNWSVGLGGISFVISIIALCISVFLMCKINGPSAGVITSLAMKPSSGYASEWTVINITKLLHELMNTTQRLDIDSENLRSNMTPKEFKHWSWSINLTSTILQASIMIFIMIICTWHLRSCVERIFERNNARHGYYPVNKKAIINLGENKVVAFFLMELSGICASKRHVEEVGIVLASIFSHPKDWYLQNPINISKWIEPLSNSRFSRNVHVKLN